MMSAYQLIVEYRSTKITEAIYHADKPFCTGSYDYNLSYQINITHSQLLLLLAYFDNFFFVFSILFFTINYLKLHNCINVTKTRGTLGSSLKSLGKLV